MDALLDWLLPRWCLACSTRLSAAGRPAGPLGLCLGCEERLVRVDREPACALCAGKVAAGSLCAGCALAPPPWRRLHAIWLYAPPLRELVHAWKFRRLDYLGRPLGTILGREVRARSTSPLPTALAAGASPPGCPDLPEGADLPEGPDLPDLPDLPHLPHLPHLIVPMPLAWPRRLARGFNQTELLAAAVAEELGRPSRRALRRGVTLVHQTGRSRRERLAGGAATGRFAGAHFFAAPFARLAGRNVLLVDDVLTTGATARAAAAGLLRAGALSVELAVVARTPEGAREGAKRSFDTP